MGEKPMAGRDRTIAAPSARRKAADRLCEIATDLFYKRGIRAVGVDEIVSEAGVTKPTLYRNYASKDLLVSACLTAQIADAQKKMDAIAQSLPDDPLAQLRAIIVAMAEDMSRPDYRGCPMTNAAVEFPDSAHPARKLSESCKADVRRRIGDLARRLDTPEPDTLADGLVLLIEGACTSRHTSGSQGPAAALLHAAEKLISAYLRP